MGRGEDRGLERSILGHLSDGTSSGFTTSPICQQTEAGDERADQIEEIEAPQDQIARSSAF